MKLAFLKELCLLENASLDTVAKKHNLKKVLLPRYHDAPGISNYALQSSKGKTVINVEITPKKDLRADEKPVRVSQGRKHEYFKTLADAVSYLDKVTVDFDDAPVSDEKIIKWLSSQITFKIKFSDIKDLAYIEWSPKSTQVVERSSSMSQIPYIIFIDGDNAYDDKSALGEINMTTKDFREWLVKHGAKKTQKPKRQYSGSYYD